MPATSALYAAAIGSDRWKRVTPQEPYREYMNQVVVEGADWFVQTVAGVLRGQGTTELSTRPNPCRVPTGSGGPHFEPSGLGGVTDNGAGVLALAVSGRDCAILRTIDDGTNLHDCDVSAPSGGLAWTDLGLTTSSQAVVVLENSGLCLSRDAGRSWSPVRF